MRVMTMDGRVRTVLTYYGVAVSVTLGVIAAELGTRALACKIRPSTLKSRARCSIMFAGLPSADDFGLVQPASGDVGVAERLLGCKVDSTNLWDSGHGKLGAHVHVYVCRACMLDADVKSSFATRFANAQMSTCRRTRAWSNSASAHRTCWS